MDQRLKAERPVPRPLLALVALALAVALFALSSGPADAATTFTVNKTGDAGDMNLADTVCDASAKIGSQCTLRAAIQEANDTLGADTINFKIGGRATVKTINVGSTGNGALPTITEAVTINGYTQRRAKENTLATGNDAVLKVQLNGTNAGAGADGLTITASADGSTIKGLVINRFDGDGVLIGGAGAQFNKVEGNFIGTNAKGTKALGNALGGVLITGANNNTIGGTQPAQRNVISGNGGNDPNNLGGVEIFGDENKVEGNFIGTNAKGTEAVGNGDGVFISGINNTIGGTASGARNVISGNDDDGVEIDQTTLNKVEGNFIGTKANGIEPLGNFDDGVIISGASDNTVGGTTSGARNVISGNQSDGVQITSGGATGNEILGNFIGTDKNGTADLGNGSDGVDIFSGADNNTVGGTTSGARNVISGNTGDGVSISTATGNEVLGNFVGTDAGGTKALGNGDTGVEIFAAPNNTVGGTTSGARNVISGNTGDGVQIGGSAATGNRVEGNFIGTDAGGTAALGNGQDGVDIFNAAAFNTVGGTASGAGNRIAFNDDDGVSVSGSGSAGNSVLSNSIFSNAGLGIDLGTDGVTANDDDDPDTGANNLQNFPVITSAIRDSATGTTSITGTLNSNPIQSFLIQCFETDVVAPAPAHGEGQRLLDFDVVSTNPGGDSETFFCNGTGLVAGDTVSATATKTNGPATLDTSEFSENETVVQP